MLTNFSVVGSALSERSIAELYILSHVIMHEGANTTTAELHHNRIEAILVELAHSDPDSCCAMLEILHGIISKAPPESLIVPKPRMLASFHRVASATLEEAIKIAAQSAIAEALSSEEHKVTFFSEMDEEYLSAALNDLEYQCLHSSPTSMQSALRLQGYFLDALYYRYQEQPKRYWRRICSYVRLLRRSIDEINVRDSDRAL